MFNIKDWAQHAENQQRLIVGLCIALACLTGFTFIYDVWQWRDDWVLINKAPPALPADDDSASMNLIARIKDAHLFGLSIAGGNMPVTNLQFVVTGIIKTEDGSSKASISIAGQPSKIYQTGDGLPYGVKVYEITPDTVILENDGRLEKLPLPREKLQFKPFSAEERE